MRKPRKPILQTTLAGCNRALALWVLVAPIGRRSVWILTDRATGGILEVWQGHPFNMPPRLKNLYGKEVQS